MFPVRIFFSGRLAHWKRDLREPAQAENKGRFEPVWEVTSGGCVMRGSAEWLPSGSTPTNSGVLVLVHRLSL